MNYWNLYRKPQHSWRQKLERVLFGFVSVENSERHAVESLFVGINYCLAYVIVFFLIMQSLARQFINIETPPSPTEPQLQFVTQPRLSTTPTSNSNFQLITILFLIRIAFAIIYIIVQKIYFLIINKVLLIVNIFLVEYQSTNEDFIQIEISLFVVEIVALAVWAYKIERRIKHFDSRLHFRYPLVKEFIVNFMALLVRRAQKMVFSPMILHDFIIFDTQSKITLNELQILIIFSVGFGVIILTDLSDALYNQRFKRLLLAMDSLLIILLISWIVLHVMFSQIFTFYYYLALVVVMIVLMFFGLTASGSFKQLYSVEARFLEYQSEDWLLDYFQTLRRLIQMEGLTHREGNLEMIKFIEFHRSSCLYTVCPLTQRFNVTDSVQIKAELIREYMIKEVEQLMPTKPVLKKYLIYYLSPNDKVYRYLNSSAQEIDKKKAIQKQQYVKRQLYRLASQKKDRTTEIKILQAQVIKTQILQLIKQYLISAKQFYSILSKDRINAVNLLLYGNKMLELIEKVEFLKQNNSSNFTQGVRVLINNFTSRLAQYPKSGILQTVIDPPFLIHKTTQTCPTLLISAEPENFLSIIDTNIACTKEFYLSRQVFVQLNALDLIPQQIRVNHQAYFRRISKKIEFDGVKNFPTALFTFNKSGYATFFIGDVYSFYSIKGRIWCVAIDIIHKLKSIILIAKQGNVGKVIGVSQMAVFHGFSIKDKGRQFTKEFFSSLLTKKEGSTTKYKRVTVEAYEKIFENCEFYFMDTKIMQIIEENTAFGLTYYLIEVNSQEDDQRFRLGSRSSLSKTSMSIDMRSYLSISEQQEKFIPKFQFHYHSDGVIRTQQQKSQDLIYNFSKYASQQQNQQLQIAGELGENIVEMRLMGQQLDFLQNIDQQQQFMSKPLTRLEKKANQINQFSLQLEFFKECMHNRKQSLPKWLLYTRVFFITITAAFLLGHIFIYVETTLMVTNIDTQSQIISLLSDNELRLIDLSKLMLGYKYYMTDYLRNVSIHDAILKVTKQYENNSKNLYSLDSSISNYFSAGSLQNVLSQYFIAFNNLSMLSFSNLTIINQFDDQSVLSAITQSIIPAFNSIISQKLSSFLSNLESTIRVNMIIMFFLDVVTVCIWVWVILLLRHVQKIKNDLLWLMSKIHDKFIDKQLIKIFLFEEYLHFDKDIYCEDDLDYIMQTRRQQNLQKYETSQQQNDLSNRSGEKKKKKISYKRRKTQQNRDQQSINADSTHKIASQKKLNVTENQLLSEQLQDNPYIKKVIYPNKIDLIIVITLVWTAIVIVLNYFFFSSVSDFSNLSEEYILLGQNLDQIQQSSDHVWLLLNKYPNNQSQMNFHIHHMYQAERDFKSGLVTINRQGGFDSEGVFIRQMQHIWHNDCCDYVGNVTPNCRGELNGALMQGADQIIAYQFRCFDYFIWINYTETQAHQSPYTLIISNIQIFYFAEVKSLTTNLIFEQHNLQRDKHQRVFFGYFVAIIICFSLIGVLYKLLSNQNEACIRVEQLFKLFEFDSLKNGKQFKLYIKQTYYDKIFK